MPAAPTRTAITADWGTPARPRAELFVAVVVAAPTPPLVVEAAPPSVTVLGKAVVTDSLPVDAETMTDPEEVKVTVPVVGTSVTVVRVVVTGPEEAEVVVKTVVVTVPAPPAGLDEVPAVIVTTPALVEWVAVTG